MRSLILHKYLFVLVTVIFACVLNAQVYDPERQELRQPVYMDSTHHQLNLYDFSNNIAALLNDSKRTIFLLGYHTEHLNGPFHLPFQAAGVHDHNFYFWSVYPISETDLFKGYFGYNYQIEENVRWNDQAWNADTNPFLLGDSSQGDFRTTGLYWAAEWGHKFNRQWQSGFGFFYHVDQRVKDIFPKPFNDHLQYVISFSTQYSLSKMIFGLNYSYVSQQEKVRISRYNLEQNLTPVIFKFRYSDLPVILRGATSEEREMQMNGHDFSLQSSYSTGEITIMGDAGIKIRESETFDGGTERLPQGKIEIQDQRMKILLDYGRIFYFKYSFKDWFLEAFHPLYQDMTVIRRNFIDHNLSIGAKFLLINNIPAFIDLHYAIHSDEMDDLMTVNKWRFMRHTAGLRLGSALNLMARLTFTTWISINFDKFNDIYRTCNQYSGFFKILYEERLNYYLEHQNEGYGGISLFYNYRPVFELEASFYLSKKNSKLEIYQQDWLFCIGFSLFVL